MFETIIVTSEQVSALRMLHSIFRRRDLWKSPRILIAAQPGFWRRLPCLARRLRPPGPRSLGILLHKDTASAVPRYLRVDSVSAGTGARFGRYRRDRHHK